MKSGLGWVVLLTSLLAAGCGDDDGAPPGVIATGNDDDGDKDNDGGTGEDSDIPPLPTLDGGGGDDDPIRIDASMADVEVVPIQPGPDAGDNIDVAGPAPEEWTCDETLWAERDSTGDYNCDCGCGAVDFADCLATSCADAECSAPGCDVCRTDDGQYQACDAPDPSDWNCVGGMGDGECDCGCKAQDPDCGGAGCLEPGCFTLACELTHDRIGDPMPVKTTAWQCSPDRFGDGVCDCGCLEADSDCFDMGCSEQGCNMAACELCHSDGDYVVPCDDTSDNWNWGTCRAFRFGSGDGCDESCGATDPDCLGSSQTDEARRCWDGNRLSGCNVVLTGSDPDKKWLCDPEHYGTGDGCDCGCGAPDPDCDGGGCQSGDCSGSDSCDYCHDVSYEPGDPLHWLACGGWDADRCPANAMGDGICDCGCGELDPDCRDLGHTGCTGAGCQGGTCEQCWDADGNASTDCDTWTCDDELARDGVCDCGCGARDPDCEDDEGCSDKGCRAPGCDLCHTGDTGDILQTCGDWHCDWSAYEDGETCDCGCGAPDPDCGNGTGRGCIVPGCRDILGSPRADECEVCHDHLGRPIECAPK